VLTIVASVLHSWITYVPSIHFASDIVTCPAALRSRSVLLCDWLIDLTLVPSFIDINMKYGNCKRKKKSILSEGEILVNSDVCKWTSMCVCVCVHIHTCNPMTYIFVSVSQHSFKESVCKMWLPRTYLCHKACRHAQCTLVSFVYVSCKGRYYLV
jgi:hypothetical protein